MAHPSDDLANNSVQRRLTFGVSRLWTPHVVLINFIYYVLLSPQQYVGHALWTLGTFIRVLVGGRTVNAAVAFMWTIHVFEAAYTTILARRYGATFVIGLSYVLATLLFGRPGWEELSNRAREPLARRKVA